MRQERGEISRLAVPILIGMMPDSLVSLVSMITASKLSTEALAGTGLASYFFFVINALTSIFMTGLIVVLSQAYGAGNREILERAFNETLLFATILSLSILATSFIWVRSYVEVLSGGQKETSEAAETYLTLRLISMPAVMINSVLATAYRALNKPWPPNYSTITSAIFSVILIPSLALGYLGLPSQGVAGMGLASTVSQYLGLLVYVFFKPPIRVRFYMFSTALLKVLGVGVPASIERFISSVGQNIYINAVSKSGIKALAAHNIGISIESLIINPVFALNIATSARVGFHIGSNSARDIDSLTRESLLIGVLWMSIATAILVAISPFAGRFFTSDTEIAGLVMFYLIFAAISEIGFGGSLAISGVIRGMGNTWIPLAVNSFTVIILRAFLAQILQPQFGVYGVWFTQITDMYGRFLISYTIYSRSKNRLAIKLV
ncbi:MAG: MATE family efflux transporter [Sulfolobales archaeon]